MVGMPPHVMIDPPHVMIDAADLVRFTEAADAAGLTVGQWLTDAGRARLAPAHLWHEVLRDVQTSPQQQVYLKSASLAAVVEDTVLLSVPDAFTRDVLESRLRPALTEALSRRLGRPVQVAVTVHQPGPAAPAPAPDDVQRYAEMLADPAIARRVAEVLADAGR